MHRNLLNLLTGLSGLLFVLVAVLWLWSAMKHEAQFIGSHRVTPPAAEGGRVTVVWAGACLDDGRIVLGRRIVLRSVAWFVQANGVDVSRVSDFEWFARESHLTDGDDEFGFPMPLEIVSKTYDSPPANAKAELRRGRMPVFIHDGSLWAVTVHYWFILIVAMALPVGRGWRAFDRYVVRRNRRMAMCCPACGYDLRATPERCPECGTTVGSTAAASPSGGEG
jgi:hypothetical protein